MPLQHRAQMAQGPAQSQPQGGKQRADLPPEVAPQPGVIPDGMSAVKRQPAQQLTPGDEGAAFETQAQPGGALLGQPAESHQHRAAAQEHGGMCPSPPEGLQGAIAHSPRGKNREGFDHRSFHMIHSFGFSENFTISPAETVVFMVC